MDKTEYMTRFFLSLVFLSLPFCLTAQTIREACVKYSYAIEPSKANSADASLFLSFPDEGLSKVQIVLIDGGTGKSLRSVKVDFEKGKRKLVFEKLKKGSYLVQVFAKKDCSFVLNGFQGIVVK